MKIVFPVSSSDLHLLEAQTKVQEYHNCLQDMEVFLSASTEVAQRVENEYLDRYRALAKSASMLNAQYSEVGSWPHGPNKHWCHTVYALDALNNRDCWLWHELDLWGLAPWARQLSDEYLKSQKRFLGKIVPTPHRDQEDKIVYKDDDEMMMGCAVYAAQMTTVSEFRAIAGGLISGPVHALPNLRTDPFDLKLRGFFKKSGWANTDLIGDRWNTCNYRMEEGVLRCDSGPARFKDMAHHDTDISKAIMIHGAKDDSLANLILDGKFGRSAPSFVPSQQSLPPAEPALVATSQNPSLILLQGLLGCAVTPQQHATFLSNLALLTTATLSVDQSEDKKPDPSPKEESLPERPVQQVPDSGTALIISKLESIVASKKNIRLADFSTLFSKPKDEMKSIIEANGFQVGVGGWISKSKKKPQAA